MNKKDIYEIINLCAKDLKTNVLTLFKDEDKKSILIGYQIGFLTAMGLKVPENKDIIAEVIQDLILEYQDSNYDEA